MQAQALNLLQNLQEEFGLSYIVISSHDLAIVKDMSDDVMVMRNSEVVLQGDSDDRYAAPKHEYTKKLFDSIPRACTVKRC